MQEIFLGSAISGLVGFLLALPAMVLEPRRRTQDVPMLIQIKFLWSWKFNDREVFAVSLLFHLIIATLVGGCYVFFARQGWLFITHAPFTFYSVMIFTLITWILLQLIIFPLLGMGLLAHREGKHLWFETLVTHMLIGIGFWLGVQYYHPFFF